MNFLIGPALVAIAASFVSTRVFEFFSDILVHDTPEAAKGAVSTLTFGAVLTKMGMTSAGKKARILKAKADGISDNKIVKAIIKKGTELE